MPEMQLPNSNDSSTLVQAVTHAATMRHTASHVLAQAVKRLYGRKVKLSIGPAIENGFYYDFDPTSMLTLEDLASIEQEMAKIISEDLPLRKFILSHEQAVQWAIEQDEPYKLALIEDLPADTEISFYQQGEFVDLCAGPHLLSTEGVKHFKLTSLAGAYWRGSEKNKMLQSIYGTAFETKPDLDAWMQHLEIGRASCRERV